MNEVKEFQLFNNQATIIVTGPTSGIGNELVQLLLSLNFRLILIGRDLDRLNELIEQYPGQVSKIEYDLSDSYIEERSYFLSRQIETLIDNKKIIFVNNAGVVQPIKKIGDFTQKNISESFSVNMFSPISIVSGIKKSKFWDEVNLYIINVSSGAAIRPIAGWSVYCSSKCSIKMFLDVFQTEEPLRVKVDHFEPGVVDTKMQTTIRLSDQNDFPLVNQFINMNDNRVLKDPTTVANELMSLIKSWLASN
jgi:benzil reductase ((S)-benzoin forming)